MLSPTGQGDHALNALLMSVIPANALSHLPVDEQVLPEGTPTFKCSRCGHVFAFDPREIKAPEPPAATPH